MIILDVFGDGGEGERREVGQDEHDHWVTRGLLMRPMAKLRPMAIGFSFSGSIMSLRSTAIPRQITRLVRISERPNISFKDLTTLNDLYA